MTMKNMDIFLRMAMKKYIHISNRTIKNMDTILIMAMNKYSYILSLTMKKWYNFEYSYEEIWL